MVEVEASIQVNVPTDAVAAAGPRRPPGVLAGCAAPGHAIGYLRRVMRVYYGKGRALTFLTTCEIVAACVTGLAPTLAGTSGVGLLNA